MKNVEEVERMLIIVDMVNGFTKEGVMHTPYMRKLIPEIKGMIEKFIENNDKVIFIKESHNQNSNEFKKFPKHCIEGTSEALIVDEFQKYVDEDNVYKKNSTSAIFAPNFMEDIKKMKNLKEVVLAGGCTDICVMNLAIPLVNYFDQNDMNVKVVVPTNACDTYDAINHNRDEYNSMAYKFMNQAGVKILKKYK